MIGGGIDRSQRLEDGGVRLPQGMFKIRVVHVTGFSIHSLEHAIIDELAELLRNRGDGSRHVSHAVECFLLLEGDLNAVTKDPFGHLEAQRVTEVPLGEARVCDVPHLDNLETRI